MNNNQPFKKLYTKPITEVLHIELTGHLLDASFPSDHKKIDKHQGPEESEDGEEAKKGFFQL